MAYNLRNGGASVPSWLAVVEELSGDFRVDPAAPKYTGSLSEGMNRLTEEEAAALLTDCRLIGSVVSDNDQEIWLLSQAGEVFRVTGDGSSRFYHVEESEYAPYLDAYSDEDSLRILSDLGIYSSDVAPAP
jgi:hypothetical protein